ncbi:hypothetical protein Scep_020928 [Stephania cephalantha]|uniref:NAC domain-containing protein n=1 Tax=Stephania cephalantha TaxID=152367 RepID=A0AAP0I1F3_9MAGN
MEKLNFVKNGVIRLPPGFRFHPTDEELVVQYLKRKAFACPLPASIIPEINVCKYDPWDLPGDGEQERYFFSTREVKYCNGNRSNRASGSGYWKATGVDKQIVGTRSNQVVGVKKTLVFYRGKSPKGSRTDWIMHEYRLVCVENSKMPIKDWVLCRIFLKKRSGRTEEEMNINTNNTNNNNNNIQESKDDVRPKFFDFMMQDKRNGEVVGVLSCTSSSASSGITEASSTNASDSDETSSCNNTSFSLFPCRREA